MATQRNIPGRFPGSIRRRLDAVVLEKRRTLDSETSRPRLDSAPWMRLYPVMSKDSITPAGRAASAPKCKKHLGCLGAADPCGTRKRARDDVAFCRSQAMPPGDRSTEGARQAVADMRWGRCRGRHFRRDRLVDCRGPDDFVPDGSVARIRRSLFATNAYRRRSCGSSNIHRWFAHTAPRKHSSSANAVEAERH